MRIIKKISYTLTILLAGVVISAPTMAIPLVGDIDIDFRDNSWGAGNNQNAITIGGTTVSVARPRNGTLWWDNRDGFGIRGGENDEIDGKERLKVSFADEVNLEGVWITDLFDAPDGSGSKKGEIGWLKIFFGGDNKSDEKEVFFGKDSDQVNGEQFVEFDVDWDISWIKFGAKKKSGNEYSIAGFEIASTASVPAPASLLLLILGLIGIRVARRR